MSEINKNQSYSIEKENKTFASDYIGGEKVTRFKTIKGIDYPHIELETDTVKRHLLTYLETVTVKGKYEDLDNIEGYTIYLKIQGKMLRVGILPKEKYPILLNPLFDSFKRKLRLSDTEEFEGENLYAFCPPVV